MYEYLEERLAEYGLAMSASGELPGSEGAELWDVDLSRRDAGWRRTMVAAHLPEMTMRAYDRVPWPVDGHHPRFVFGSRISIRSADHFRALGVNYLDTAGNAWIRDDGVLVDVRGRKSPASAHTAEQRTGAVNLFSTKRSQVLFALLSWPELIDRPVRTVARIAGVSVGLVSEVFEQLELLERPAADLRPGGRARDAVIDQWVASFPSGLGSDRRTRRFGASDSAVRPVAGVEIALGGEAATEWLRAQSVSVWVRPWVPQLAVENRWRTTSTPNVAVREMFWRTPWPKPGGIRAAPPLIVYAELKAMNDARSREAADRLRSETGLVDD